MPPSDIKTLNTYIMSDSVAKYHELVEEGKIDPNISPEEVRETRILELLALATKSGKIDDIEQRASEVREKFGTTSLLLSLEIAIQEVLGLD